MNCMKCGREIEGDQVFCDICRIEMEQYPVKPGTVILLPSQVKQPPKKAQPRKKPVISPEDQLPTLKKKVWRLRFLAMFLTLLIAGLTYVTSRVITELDIQRLLGQNYSTYDANGNPTKPPIITGR